MANAGSDTDELLHRAASGDDSARGELLLRHRDRLRQMVTLRLDPQLSARIDASDIVQEAFVDASRRLSEYLSNQPLPFYPWLRGIALDRLADVHRRHLHARKRSMWREDRRDIALSDESLARLASHLINIDETPSRQLLRKEYQLRVRSALGQLAAHDREVLVMRYLEQLSIGEIAAILDITEGAAKSRQRRALERLMQFLEDDFSGSQP